MSIELINRENGTRAIKLTNIPHKHAEHGVPAINGLIESDEVVSFGELTDGYAALEHHAGSRTSTHDIPMTPAIHADIKQHIKIPETKRTAGEPFTPPRVIDIEQLAKDSNNHALLLAALVQAKNPVPYPYWRMKTNRAGVSHLLGVEGENEMVCRIPMLGATICATPRDVTPEHDGKRTMTIVAANGAVHVFNTENSGEFGQISIASERGAPALGEEWPDILPNRE